MIETLQQLQAVGIDGGTAVLAVFCYGMFKANATNTEILRRLTDAVARLGGDSV